MSVMLDPYFDSHWLFVNRYQGTSFNIVPRVIVDLIPTEAKIQQSLSSLLQTYPYLTARIEEEKTESLASSFSYTVEKRNEIAFSVNRTSDAGVDAYINELSPLLSQRLDIESGEQVVFNFLIGESKCLIEIVFAHILGDATSSLMLLSDFLRYLDDSVTGKHREIKVKEKVPFDAKALGWAPLVTTAQRLPIPEVAPDQADWPRREMIYARYCISRERFKEISKKLNDCGIDGTATDFFYFIQNLMYKRLLGKSYQISTVLSFRNQLPEEQQKSHSTSAVFCPSSIDDEFLDDPASWIKELNKIRKQSITHKGIQELFQFLESLNISLSNCSYDEGKALLSQLMPLNTFSFNNYGNVDAYLSGTSSFTVSDLNVQGSAPGQEVRIYGLNGTVHMELKLYADGGITCEEFWDLFMEQVNKVLLKIECER